MKKIRILEAVVAIIMVLVAVIWTSKCYETEELELTVYATHDSYAYGYAKDHKMNVKKITQDDLDKLPLHLEDFHYDIEDDKVTIFGYSGLSEKLYIPKTIDGYDVVKISEKDLGPFVKEIVIPETIEEINETLLSNVKIYCYKNDYCESLKEKNYNVEYLSDRSYYYIDNSPKNFSYKMKYDKIIIEYYREETKDLVIPETINGYKVNRLNISTSKYSNIYIPDSIIQISDYFVPSKSLNPYKISIVMEVVALIVVIGTIYAGKHVNLFEKKYYTQNVVVSFMYLLLVFYRVYRIYVSSLNETNMLVSFIVETLIFIILESEIAKRCCEDSRK